MFLFNEFDGSGVCIRENFFIIAGANLLTNVCPSTPVIDSSPVIQEHALLLFGAQPHAECGRIVLTLVSSFYVIPGLYRATATPPQWKK